MSNQGVEVVLDQIRRQVIRRHVQLIECAVPNPKRWLLLLARRYYLSTELGPTIPWCHTMPSARASSCQSIECPHCRTTSPQINWCARGSAGVGVGHSPRVAVIGNKSART